MIKRGRRNKVLTVQLPCAAVTPEMAARVQQYADDNDTSQSDVIRRALRLFFSSKNGKSSNSLIIQETGKSQ